MPGQPVNPKIRHSLQQTATGGGASMVEARPQWAPGGGPEPHGVCRSALVGDNDSIFGERTST